MALNFPSNPANGDIYQALGRGWKYNGSAGIWESLIRVNTAFTTDDIAEGTTHLYGTHSNITNSIDSYLQAGTNITLDYDQPSNTLTINSTGGGGGGNNTLTLQNVIDNGNTSTTSAVIPFYYANQGAFPSATTYHGAIAHSHSDGAMYFAHGGSWNKLANDSETASLTAFSVGAEAVASGNGAISYDNSTGEFTYTPPILGGLTGTSDDITEGSTNFYYTDTKVDTHLNTGTASINDVLSWNGSDYAWVAQTGGGSSLTIQEEGVTLATTATTLNFIGTGITAAGTGATKTITVTGTHSDTDTLTEGSTNLYFTNTRADARIGAANLADLNNVSATAPSTGEVLKWDGSQWAPAVDATTGGSGLDADTLDGQDGSYYLDYNNFTNTPTLFDGAFSSLTGKPTTLSGYGITDGYANSDVDAHLNQTNPVAGYVLSWNGSDYAWISNTGYTGFNTDFDTRFATKSTSDLAEGSNLYFTNGRADARISAANLQNLNNVNSPTAGNDGHALFWNNTSAVFELLEIPNPAGYNNVNWDTAYSWGDHSLVGYLTSIAPNSINDTHIDFGSGTNQVNTTDLPEGTNLYYTDARFDARLNVKTTDNLSEGVTNLYYTDARADARVNAQTGANLDLSSKNTGHLAEGSNLYYTDARVDARLSSGSVGNIVTTGYIAGPSTFTIDPSAVGDNTGTVVIAGNLQVDGTTTTINSSELTVDDLNITIASGAINAAAADGAGITVDGASATFSYQQSNDSWTMNKQLDMGSRKILYSNVYNQIVDLPTASTYHGMFAHVHGTGHGYFAHAGNWIQLLDTASSIDELTDVDTTTVAPTDGQALIWDNANSKWKPGASTGFSQADFDTAFAAKDIGGLNNVDTTGVADKHVLYYDNATSEFKVDSINNIGLSNAFFDIFTATGSTNQFTLSQDPGSSAAVQVFVDGVPQLSNNYTVVGTTLTLGGTPTNGQKVEVKGYGLALNIGTVADASITAAKLQDGTFTLAKLAPIIYQKQVFTGDGATSAYTLDFDPEYAQTLLVLIDNVIQEPVTNYTTSGTTLTFNGIPPLNSRVYIRYLGLPVGSSGTPPDDSITNAKLNLTYTSNQYTGDGSSVNYTIADGHTANSVLVILDGLILPPTDYSVAGTTLTFASAPLLNQQIDVRYMPV